MKVVTIWRQVWGILGDYLHRMCNLDFCNSEAILSFYYARFWLAVTIYSKHDISVPRKILWLVAYQEYCNEL